MVIALIISFLLVLICLFGLIYCFEKFILPYIPQVYPHQSVEVFEKVVTAVENNDWKLTKELIQMDKLDVGEMVKIKTLLDSQDLETKEFKQVKIELYRRMSNLIAKIYVKQFRLF